MTRHPQSADAPEAKRELTADRFITKLRRRNATSGVRLYQALRDAEARFNRREATWRCALLADVVEPERSAAIAMAHALELEIDVLPPHAPPSPSVSTADDIGPAVGDVVDDVPSRPSLEEYDGVPERLREPLSPERLAVARKR